MKNQRNRQLTLSKPSDWQGFSSVSASTRQVDVIVRGMSSSLRNADTETEKALILTIQNIGQSYGARGATSDNVLLEIKRFILEKFGSLSLAEITEAWRMAAAGELKVNSEIYGGELNANVFGRVLVAYRDFRRSVVAEIVKREDRILKLQEAAERRERGQAAFDASLPKLVENAKSKVKKWEDVFEFWYEGCLRVGLVSIDRDLANLVWSIAGKIVEREGVSVKQVAKRRKVVSRKIYLFHKLFGGDLPDLEAI